VKERENAREKEIEKVSGSQSLTLPDSLNQTHDFKVNFCLLELSYLIELLYDL